MSKLVVTDANGVTKEVPLNKERVTIGRAPDNDIPFAGDKAVTWCGFARAIVARAVEVGVIAKAPRIVGIATPEYPTPAKRPAYSVLDSSRIGAVFGIEPSDWQAALVRILVA